MCIQFHHNLCVPQKVKWKDDILHVKEHFNLLVVFKENQWITRVIGVYQLDKINICYKSQVNPGW